MSSVSQLDAPDSSLLEGDREDLSLRSYLVRGIGLPDGSELSLKPPEKPKVKYTDLREVYKKPFQEPKDFEKEIKQVGRKKKKKAGRPKNKRQLTKEEQRKLNSLNVISSRKNKIKELIEGGMSFAKSKKLVLKEK